jgi:hypothetical protein
MGLARCSRPQDWYRRPLVPLKSAGVIVVSQDFIDQAAVACGLLLAGVDVLGQAGPGHPQPVSRSGADPLSEVSSPATSLRGAIVR